MQVVNKHNTLPYLPIKITCTNYQQTVVMRVQFQIFVIQYIIIIVIIISITKTIIIILHIHGGTHHLVFLMFTPHNK